MSYILVDDQNNILLWPATFKALRERFKNVSFPKDSPERWAEFGLHQVVDVPAPAPSDPDNFKVVEVNPTFDGTNWNRTYTEVALTQAEKDAIAERAANEADKAALKAEQFYQTLAAATPQELSDWFDSNVTDLASARATMKKMALVLLMAVRYGTVK